MQQINLASRLFCHSGDEGGLERAMRALRRKIFLYGWLLGFIWSKVWYNFKSRKRFFLKIPAQVVRGVNMQRDENDLISSQKSMVRGDLAKQAIRMWETKQLYPQLKIIMLNYRVYFDKDVPDENSKIALILIHRLGQARSNLWVGNWTLCVVHCE